MERKLYRIYNGNEYVANKPHLLYFSHILQGTYSCDVFIKLDYEYDLNENQLILNVNYGVENTTGGFTQKPNNDYYVKINDIILINESINCNSNITKNATYNIPCKFDGSTGNFVVSRAFNTDITDTTFYMKPLFVSKLKLNELWKLICIWVKTQIGWKRCIIWQKINGIWKCGE